MLFCWAEDVALVLDDVEVLETLNALGLTVPRPDWVRVAAVLSVGWIAGAVVETVDMIRDVCALEAAGCVPEICCVEVVSVSKFDVLGSGGACEVNTTTGVWLAVDCVSEVCCVVVVVVIELDMLGSRGACEVDTTVVVWPLCPPPTFPPVPPPLSPPLFPPVLPP